MGKIPLGIAVLFVVSIGCRQGKVEGLSAFRELADSTTTTSQMLLFQKVSKAIGQGGAAHALDFCNLRATGITDSLSRSFQMDLQRISDNNRNPDNGLKTGMDQAVFERFLERPGQRDSLLFEGDHPVYYKRIDLAMISCLKCHGNPKTDIEPATLERIQALYPRDRALDYQVGDLRGLWKVVPYGN